MAWPTELKRAFLLLASRRFLPEPMKSSTTGSTFNLRSRRGRHANKPLVYGCRGFWNRSQTRSSSTLFPWYMTIIRSATSAITPKSCVMKMVEVSCASRSSCINSRMVFCTVTSSAVVGSSAIRIIGWHESAMAIITRCFCPPESWCGYLLMSNSGLGRCTLSKSSMVRFLASMLLIFWCSSIVSMTWAPTVCTGLSELMGFWNIMLISPPRNSWSSSLSSSKIFTLPFLDWKIISPSTTRPGGLGTRRSSESEVTDLPEPDSPTIPSVSPL